MKKKKTVEASMKVGTMTLTANFPEAEVAETLEALEKKFDLAGARLTYALTQKLKWDAEAHKRSQEFNRATVLFKQKKHGFSDADIQDNLPVSHAVWSYAK